VREVLGNKLDFLEIGLKYVWYKQNTKDCCGTSQDLEFEFKTTNDQRVPVPLR